jgi:hypothetical protein
MPQEEPESLSKEDNGGRNQPEPKVEEAERSAPQTQAPEPIKRPDPTRYGDWEKDGRCIDF